MGIQLPGDLLPGAVGVVETQTVSTQFTESTSEQTVSVTLDGDFDATADMAIQTEGRVETSSGSSSSTQVDETNIDEGTVTTDGFDVTVTLDSAPGAGETTDVIVSVTVAEGGD